jgi:hypothetical protein
MFDVVAHDVLSKREILYALWSEVVADAAQALVAFGLLRGRFVFTQPAVFLA